MITDLLERNIITGGRLPPLLPPKPRRDDDGPFIVPEIGADTSKVYDRQNNWITICHIWMHKVWGFYERCEVAHVNSRRYHQWLETYPPHKLTDGLPPHIQFGGGIVRILGGDPTFYNRWVEYAQKTFC